MNDNSKRKYQRVTDQQRQQLIQLVVAQGITIKQAALDLKISYDNAKAIHRVYKKETRVDKRSTRRRVQK